MFRGFKQVNIYYKVKRWINNIGEITIARIDRYLADPRLEPEAQLRKRWAWIWFLVTCVFVLISCVHFFFVVQMWPMWWGGVIFIAGYIVGFPLLKRVKRFDIVINAIFSVYTITAMFMMLHTGGLTTSMGFIFIGMNCAMGSVLAGNLRWSFGMVILYCATIVVVGIFQSSLTTPDYITPRENTISFVGLALWINACILFIVILFMKDKNKYEKAEAEKLRKIDEAKTLLYTNVSHEFRTPLTVIQGIADQMEQNTGYWRQHGPAKIKKQSSILLRLVNQMLNISKLEAGSMRLDLIQGDLRKYVRHLTASFQSLAQKKKIELAFNQKDSPLIADFDKGIVFHAVSNLLSNAIKFTPPGGEVTVLVTDKNINNKQSVVIEVADTGKGIPVELHERIFERFYQVPDEDIQTPGTGLGLSLTRQMVQLIKGEIRLESEPGLGSRFKIILPLSNTAKKADDADILHPEFTIDQFETGIDAHEKSFRINSLKKSSNPILLIVEDNADVVEYLVEVLHEDYTIELANNGMEGLEKAQQIIPDIILSDVMMPKMDGFELLRQLRNDFRTDHIPMMILTARGDYVSKIEGLEIGADQYLVKPFDEKDLKLRLRNLFESRRKMQAKLAATNAHAEIKSAGYRRQLEFISKINTLLDENLSDEEFGITQIYRALNMSRAQLYRKFSALTNKSLGHHIRSYRLHNAKQMIVFEGKNVTEAALASGFKNLSHFSAAFHEEFGFAPSEINKSGISH